MQSKQNIDVLIIGVGAAGLIAWRELHSVGLHVVVLEARDRIGGRILTDHSTSSPIELGAEFVHGKPKAIWPILEKARLKMLESSDTRMVFDKGGLRACAEYWKIIINPGAIRDLNTVMEAMIQATQKNEESRLNYEWAISADRQACHIYEC